MNLNTNKNIAIAYNENIISKIFNLMNSSYEKLKNFIKTKELNVKFYYELNERFNDIALKLEKLMLYEELGYFLALTRYISYIIKKNIDDEKFGHCDFALELLNFFIELFQTNLNFYKVIDKTSINEFNNTQEKLKMRYWQYRRKFYLNIYDPADNLCEDEIIKIMESMRGQ